MTTQFLIGCDPEVFVRSKDGSYKTAHGLIPGDKEKPHKVADGAVQVDGMALEFNIEPTPSGDFALFDKRVLSVMGQMRKMLPEGLGFAIEPSVQFDKDYYESVPESAKELGCDPDFCAYSADIFEPNTRPDGDSGLRSAAGHIHVGWAAAGTVPVDNPEHVEICRSFVRNLDVFVGLAMTIIDNDARRRSLYGKAGAYRPKSYGVEYRTPSNVWLKSQAHRRFIHSMTTRAISDMQTGDPAYARLERSGYDVASIINAGDAKAAEKLLTEQFYITVADDLKPKAA